MSLKQLTKPMLYRLGMSLAPSLLFRIQNVRMHRRFGSHWYWPDLRSPRTFNEKLLRSKLDKEHSHLSHLVDKADVKGWVARRIGPVHVIPSIGVFDSAEAVPIETLPRPCIIKPTHASGHVLILCGDENDPTPEVVLGQMKSWQRINHWSVSGEPQYRNIPPRIICEPLLGDKGVDLPDYKFFCFYGEPLFIQVDLDRHSGHKRRFYDLNWQLEPFTLRYPMAQRDIDRPHTLDKMSEIATILSRDFKFVRVDLYTVDNSVYFGELTFHPESGTAPFSDFETDLRLGALMDSQARQIT